MHFISSQKTFSFPSYSISFGFFETNFWKSGRVLLLHYSSAEDYLLPTNTFSAAIPSHHSSCQLTSTFQLNIPNQVVYVVDSPSPHAPIAIFILPQSTMWSNFLRLSNLCQQIQTCHFRWYKRQLSTKFLVGDFS